MFPARSIILFTTLSGAGFGALAWLGLLGLAGGLPEGTATALLAGGLAMALAVAGLIASTFHLRHPERAWRAFSQWRSSWLSREGVFSVATLGAALAMVAAWMLCGPANWVVTVAGIATLLGALATVVSTAMIYRSLWAVPQWHNGWTVPVFLALAAASGGLVLCAVLSWTGALTTSPAWLAIGTLLAVFAAVVAKTCAWNAAGHAVPASDTPSALGLSGRAASAHPLEAPHTSETWLQHEMAYRVARKHATRLRSIAALLGLGLALPALLLALWMGGIGAALLLTLAALAGLAAVLVERWLFFAEARHKVTLYYGAEQV